MHSIILLFLASCPSPLVSDKAGSLLRYFFFNVLYVLVSELDGTQYSLFGQQLVIWWSVDDASILVASLCVCVCVCFLARSCIDVYMILTCVYLCMFKIYKHWLEEGVPKGGYTNVLWLCVLWLVLQRVSNPVSAALYCLCLLFVFLLVRQSAALYWLCYCLHSGWYSRECCPVLALIPA